MKVYAVFSLSQGQGETLQKIFKDLDKAEEWAFKFGVENKDWVDLMDIIDYEVE